MKAMPAQSRSTIHDTEPALNDTDSNTLRLLEKEDNSAVDSALVHSRRRWTNVKVTPI